MKAVDLAVVFGDAHLALYYRADTHWNQIGAALAARATAGAVTTPIDHSYRFSTIAELRETQGPGDLLRLMSLDLVPDDWMIRLRPPNDREHVEQTSERDSPTPSGGLLDMPSPPDVALIGSSFSRHGNFDGRLREALGARVGNFAQVGGGFAGAAKTYFSGVAFRESPPKLVIWEIPERLVGQQLNADDAALAAVFQNGVEMSKLLLGLTFLIIGDSHMVGSRHLIGTLHDDLLAQGAKAFSFGACGVTPSAWVTPRIVNCGISERLGAAPPTENFDKTAKTIAIDVLVQRTHPNVVIVEEGDPMAAYTMKQLPQDAIHQSVGTLIARITALNLPCVWIGPSWGTEGGPFFKTFARVKQVSDTLKDIVAPCQYIDSLTLSRPGEWPTFDGMHYTTEGYVKWGQALTDVLANNVTIRSLAAK